MVVAGSGVTQRAAAGSRSSDAEGDLCLSEVGVHQKDTEEDLLTKSRRRRRRAEVRVESAETQDYVSGPPLTSWMEQQMVAEDGKDMKELRFVPSAVSEPRSALDM